MRNLFIFAILFFINSVLLADNTKAFEYLKKVDQKMYHPLQKGIQDLSLTITNSLVSQHPMLSAVTATFYYKKGTGERQKTVLNGLGKLPAEIQKNSTEKNQLERQLYQFFQAYIQEFLGATFSDKLGEYETATLVTGVPYDTITLTPKNTSYLRQSFISQVLKLQSHRVISLQTMHINGTMSTSAFTYRDEEGIVIDTIEAQTSDGKSSFRYEYQKADNITFLKKITGTALNGTPFVVEFSDIKVNKGIEDTFFNE